MIVASSVFEYLVDVHRVAAGQGPAVRGRLAPDRSQSVWSRAQTRGLASVDPIEPPPFAYASENSADRLLYHLPPAFAEPLPRRAAGIRPDGRGLRGFGQERLLE